jgi:UDP-N-acetyl-D-mannosaminuronic acid dehydrogenase
MKPETVCVIGLGYIGLPTAAMFAARGVRVFGVDTNQQVIHSIAKGLIHIVEPELDMITHAAVTNGLLCPVFVPKPADAFIIAVPTPFKENHLPNLDCVLAAAGSIAPVLKPGNVVILESTSPVGTTAALVSWLAEARPDLRFPRHGESSPIDVHIAYCPERVLPGHVVRELVQNDRVIGGVTPECARRAADIYRVFVEGEMLFTDARTAEMCKLTENASRDAAVAFANELSMVCDHLEIDVWELIRLANHHPRVNIMRPGAGVGGHCIAVDPWFLVHSAPDQTRLIRAAREVNKAKPSWVVHRILDAVAGCRDRPADKPVCIALLGLAFKPNIDDLRESPAVEIARELRARCPDARLLAVEPHITQLPADLGPIELCGLNEALAQADIAAALVAHRAFMDIAADAFDGKVFIDVAGIRATKGPKRAAPFPFPARSSTREARKHARQTK